jgi:hypothetical protein
MGRAQDDAERASGAIDAARSRAEGQGNVWVDAAETLALVCTCGKKLDMNIAHHPRVPQAKQTAQKRQTGLIPFPVATKPKHGPQA